MVLTFVVIAMRFDYPIIENYVRFVAAICICVQRLSLHPPTTMSMIKQQQNVLHMQLDQRERRGGRQNPQERKWSKSAK